MRPQEAAERLQIPENTIKVPLFGKHKTARKRFTLLPMCCPDFAGPCSSAAERSEAAENMTPPLEKGRSDETDQGQHCQGQAQRPCWAGQGETNVLGK